jgi:hypothetical protein
MRKLSVIIGGTCLLIAGLAIIAQDQAAADGACTIDIHNISATLDPWACTVTVTWDTDECSSSVVYWGQSGCKNPSYPNVATGGSARHGHSVVIDVSGLTGPNCFLNYKVESSNDCETAESVCKKASCGPCIEEQ